MTFYDREDELETLTAAVESPGSDFVVVYGRRRVGKTELLKEFCADRPHMYFPTAQEAEHRQREKFLEQVADYFDERVPRIDSWDEAFEYLGETLQREDLVESLRAKAEHVRWGPSDRDERFVLFSKSGFVDGLEAQLDDSWPLFSVADIDDLLTPA